MTIIEDCVAIFRRIILWMLFIVVIFVFAIFVLKNSHIIEIYFNITRGATSSLPIFSLQLWAYSFVVFIFGIISGVSGMWVATAQQRKTYEETEKNKQKLEKDMSNLKKNISKSLD